MTISEDSMRTYQVLWHWLGLWSLPSQRRNQCTQPSQNYSRYYAVYGSFMIFTWMILFNVLNLLSLLVANSIEDITETLFVAANTTTVIYKAWILFTSRRDILQLFNMMQQLEESTVCSESDILVAAQRKGALPTTLIWYAAVVLIPGSIFNAIFQRDLMWPMLFPVDWQSNDFWYGVVITYQCISTCYLGMLIPAVDLWRTSAMCMLVGFLDVLRERMQRLGHSKKENLKDVQHRFYEKELVDCVKYHLLCLKYLRILESASKVLYLIQFTTSAILICVSAYLLTTMHPMEDASVFIWTCGYLGMCCYYLLVPCFFGSLLTDKTDQLSFSLYESNWPDMSPKFKRTMCVFLETTIQPIDLYTSCNLYIVSLPTFVSVVKSGYSMLSFLKGMK